MSIESDYNVKIPSFQLLRVLGAGGYGTCFLGSGYLENDLRVFKVLHRLGHDPEQRFEREIRILKERSNDNCVQILDHGVTEAGHLYYSMEYCPHGSIRGLVGLVNELFVTRMLAQIGNALVPFHERGGFHRDIKPDNVLLSETSAQVTFKLGDFGLAQDANTSSIFTQGPAGTLGYIAPEIIGGDPYTPASDIYSLGVTARELITGRIKGNLGFRVQPALRHLIERMIKMVPSERIEIGRVISQARKIEISIVNPSLVAGA